MYKNDKPFGGLHVVLTGDFKQMKPVCSPNTTLFNCAVQYHISDKPMPLYQQHGTNLFLMFKKYDLEHNMRSKDPIHTLHCTNLRKNKTNPITPDIVNSIKTLTTSDIETDPSWKYAPITVSTNITRQYIAKLQLIRFAKEHNEPIFTFNCPFNIGSKSYNHYDFGPQMLPQYPDLEQYFVRGAPITLRGNLCPELGISNGTIGTLKSIVWENDSDRPTFRKLKKGDFNSVPPPKYIIVNVDNRDVPLQLSGGMIEMKLERGTKKKNITTNIIITILDLPVHTIVSKDKL